MRARDKEKRRAENLVSASRADDNREINSHYSFKSMYRLVTSAGMGEGQMEIERERGRGRERVGVCKGVSNGGKWPRLPRRCSQTIPFHHCSLVPPLPYTATFFTGVLSTIDCRLLLRRDTLPYSVSRARATSSSFLPRASPPCTSVVSSTTTVRDSFLYSCFLRSQTRKLRPLALFYTIGSRVNKFSANITVGKYKTIY